MSTGERVEVLPVESELDALWADGHSRTRATELVIERAVAEAFDLSTVVLLEGLSDQIALEIIAVRRGRKLRDEGIRIVPMGGATNVRRFLTLFGPQGRDVAVAGLYDLGEENHFRRSLELTGFGHDLDRRRLESLGFFACVNDLEEEFISCLGAASIERLIDAQGELTSFRTLQNEPFHRERSHEQQLHRFIGVHSGRKYRYARLLAEATDLERLPCPIESLLVHLVRGA